MSNPWPAPKKFHLDKRAHKLLNESGADDDLLDTQEVADWFGVSTVWLETGRARGYGPKFVKMGDKVIRYRRDACRKYLRSRTFSSTAEYKMVDA